MTTVQFEDRVKAATVAAGVGRGARIGVALSGGADSVALLASLHRSGHDVTALHCDFSLRGDESDGDREYCAWLAGELGVEIHCVKFDTMTQKLAGESVEMACRRLRYAWFEQQAAGLKLTHVALGHHSEDSIETMLLNLTRGSGPRGLSGIAPERGIYFRPMLSLSRADIEEYLGALHLAYRTDSSNLSNDYRRNMLRNVILPKLYELIPTAGAGMLRTAEAMRHSASMIDTYLKWCAERYMNGGRLDIAAMAADGVDMEGTLYMLLPLVLGCNPGIDIVEQMLSGLSNHASRLFPTGDGRELEMHRGKLQLYHGEDDRTYDIDLHGDIHEPMELRVTVTDYDGFAAAPKSSDTLWLDGSILDKPHRFALRHWRDGDRMHPFGAPGHRLISDIFSDLKMSRSDKNRAFILTMDDRPLWIVGLRASNMYRVTENSKKIIKLQVR